MINWKKPKRPIFGVKFWLSNFCYVHFLSNLNPIWEKCVWKIEFCLFCLVNLNQHSTRGCFFNHKTRDRKHTYRSMLFWNMVENKVETKFEHYIKTSSKTISSHGRAQFVTWSSTRLNAKLKDVENFIKMSSKKSSKNNFWVQILSDYLLLAT